jgi:predicted DNA-binding transcriptional regulator YafY
MKITTSQLARYRVIDECLSNDSHIPSTSNSYKHIGLWPIKDLQKAIFEKLDLVDGVSERTVKEDIKRMRESDDLAYYAPISNERGVGYYYSDPNFQITNNPLTGYDLTFLNEIVNMLKQFKGFKYFEDVDSLIYRIEENVNRSEYNYIEFDTRPDASGLEHIEKIKDAIHSKTVLAIDYQPFDKDLLQLHIHPYLLKEYNHRWFVYCYTNQYKGRGVYALDRIKQISKTKLTYKNASIKIIKNYFKDIIGVTNMADRKVENIIIRLTNFRAKYMISKPSHHSQKVIKQTDTYTWFSFNLKVNNELIAFLLNYGSDLVVEEPQCLAKQIKDILQTSLKAYK